MSARIGVFVLILAFTAQIATVVAIPGLIRRDLQDWKEFAREVRALPQGTDVASVDLRRMEQAKNSLAHPRQCTTEGRKMFLPENRIRCPKCGKPGMPCLIPPGIRSWKCGYCGWEDCCAIVGQTNSEFILDVGDGLFQSRQEKPSPLTGSAFNGPQKLQKLVLSDSKPYDIYVSNLEELQ